MDTQNQNTSGRAGNYWPTVAMVVVAAAVGFVVGRGTVNDAGLASVSKSGVEEMIGIDEDTKINIVTGDEKMSASENSVAVKNQTAGNKVVIDKLALTKEVWIAIHDVLPTGPGWILGAQKFPVGNYEKFEVNLLRSTEPGKKYVAMLHISSGDEKFEFRAGEADRPLLDADKKPIMSEFQTSAQKK